MIFESLLTSHSAVSLGLLNEIEIDPDALRAATHADRLGDLAPKTLSLSPELTHIAHSLMDSPAPKIELSAIPRHLRADLRAELRTMVLDRQFAWVALIPSALVDKLDEFFGSDMEGRPIMTAVGPEVIPSRVATVRNYLTRLDDEDEVPAHLSHRAFLDLPHVPVAVNPSRWCQAWARGTEAQQSFIRAAFHGLDSSTISSSNYAALEAANVDFIKSSLAYRMLRNPKFWAYVIVFVYSSLRALPVMFVRHFEGNVWVLWTMDIVTAIPYTWGLLAFVTGHSRLKRYFGLAVTLITFVAPYIYFWTHGRDYPLGVNLIVAVMILSAIAWEGYNFMRDRAVAEALRSHA